MYLKNTLIAVFNEAYLMSQHEVKQAVRNNDPALDRVIDLSAKKSESDWAYGGQVFFESLAKLWFTWLGWILAIGAIAALEAKTGSLALDIIKEISYLILSFYFLYFLSSIRIEPYHSWSLSKPVNFKKRIYLSLNLGIGIGVWFGSRTLVDKIVSLVIVGS